MVEVGEHGELVGVSEAKPFVVVGIPAFNEERSIARVVLKAQRYADVVIVCDDGSSDLTAEIAERLGAEVVRHKERLGYGAAVRSLFRRAKELGADVFVTLDGDGQHEPSEIPGVVGAVVEGGADVAIGSRFVDERLVRGMPWYRRFGVRFITRLANNSAKSRVRDAQSGFRAYSRRALEVLGLTEDGMGVSVEILLEAQKHGLRVREVAASCSYDEELEPSELNPVRHGVSVVMAVVRRVVEERPLVYLGVPGMLCLLLGLVFGVWMLQIYAVEHHVVTNVALAALAFTLIGLFAVFTAITLYAITRITTKLNNRNEHR
ncbi:MAG: glycosyltransferase family 2 protein [Candidatus Freyarchaeota archaeon]|nr:glycosyltransferase family 2 protein [Candidatus Jordarchaeia archaeon]